MMNVRQNVPRLSFGLRPVTKRTAPILPLGAERTLVDAAGRVCAPLGIHRQKSRRDVGTRRGREREVTRYGESQLDLRPRQTSARDLVGNGDPIVPQILDLVPQSG